MHRIFITVFGFPIYSYGVMMLLAFIGATYTMTVLGARQGLDKENVVELALWLILVGIVGSRLGYVFQNLHFYGTHPLQILNLRGGGMTLITGVILSSIALAYYFRSHKIPFMNGLDMVAAPCLVGMAIGRIGCTLNGCCFGKLTTSKTFLALTYPAGVLPAGLTPGPRYPVQLYEMSLDLILLCVVLWYIPRMRYAGQAFWLFFGGYSVIRFCTEFVRYGSKIGPLTLAQWTSGLFAIIALLGWLGVFGRQPVTTSWTLQDGAPKPDSKAKLPKKQMKTGAPAHH